MKKWYEYLWIVSITYLILGIFNILFGLIGIICFITPLFIAIFQHDKAYCNKYCGRSRLFDILGSKYKLSRNVKPPKFLSYPWFRYAFLIFFMSMFTIMILGSIKVFKGAPLNQVVTLLWTFKLPWDWMNVSLVHPGVAQFSYGLYSVMLTSSLLGFVTMYLYRPRSWCSYCPMGTMTQGICKIKESIESKNAA